VRILFVTGTATGGAARSTDELAARLLGRGHEVAALTGRRSRPRRNQLDSAGRRRRAVAGRVTEPARRIAGRLPYRPLAIPGAPYPTWRSPVPEACLADVCLRFGPDVVVVSAVGRPAWRTTRSVLARTHLPCALYLRSEASVYRLTEAPLPQLVVANAWSHAGPAAALGAKRVVTVPSVVEVDACQVVSTRQRLLFVNPVRKHGLAVVLGVARERPDIPVSVHESALLDRNDMARLRTAIAPTPHVELRRHVADPRELYRDARLLLVPYQVSNRPRVVLEAQSNGIPVVASDLPALQECVGPGGLLVPPTAPPAAWAEAIGRLWDAPDRYQACASAARSHSRRPDVDPEAIVDRFEAEMTRLAEVGA
jgi:glycosyltransferase involved in cell wall biosynthesis